MYAAKGQSDNRIAVSNADPIQLKYSKFEPIVIYKSFNDYVLEINSFL